MSKTSRYFEPLSLAIAGGQRIRDAALSCGCSESTAYRVCRTVEFRSAVASHRTEATDAAVGGLSELALDAVAVLRSVMMDSGAKPADRLTAAKSALQLLAPLSELVELRSRLDALESNQLRIAQ